MTTKQIAEMIPAEYRKEILQMNMVSSAIATTTDPTMLYLGTIWKNYVAPHESLDCGLCLERILNNYRQLQPVFIAMEKSSNLLESL